jgi:hypothetical protein
VPGALEIQAGVAAVVLPEDSRGTHTIEPLGRIGYFLAEGIELEVEVSTRVWPLGAIAPKSIAVGGALSWYPNLGPQNRNVFLSGGVGVLSEDPPGVKEGTTWDGFARGAFGFKVPLEGVGLGLLDALHLSIEFREEALFQESTDFVSGAVIGFSYFR